MDDERAWENARVLDVVQALSGAVSPALQAVSIKTDRHAGRLDIYVAFDRPPGDDDLDLVREVAEDVEALTAGAVLIRTHIWVGRSWTEGWPGRNARFVYATRIDFS